MPQPETDPVENSPRPDPRRRKGFATLGGLALGILAGLAWWRFVGCATGACPLSSNPWISSTLGGVIGLTATLGR